MLLDIGLMITFLGGVAVATAWLETRATQTLRGSIKVVDGDSLQINGVEARLRGIDAPEYTQICKKGGADYACGREARAHLAKLVKEAGKNLACSGFETDTYDRLLVTCQGGTAAMSLNANMVRDGWAVAYGGHEALQRSAKAEGKGLWQGEFDLPRQWRQTHGALHEAPHTFTLSVLLDRIRHWLGINAKGTP